MTILRVAKSSADALLVVINDILDFSKIEARMMEIDASDFNIRELVETTVHGLGARADAKGIELLHNVDATVPPMLVGDAGRIRQVLVNLVGNAIKFTERGEVEVRLGLERRSGDQVVLHGSVRDTGIGIPQNKLRTIFTAFAQADGSTTREFGGTGLGLTISSQLVELMQGRVWVESEVGVGSTFHFTIELGLSSVEVTAETPVIDLAGLQVLIVDDNATNRRILGETVAKWGMRSVAVDGALPALELLEEGKVERYDLIILDGHMPGLDGYELAERIRKLPGRTDALIMMLTSLADAGQLKRCGQLGITAVLTKPVMRPELLEAVVSVLRGNRIARTRPPPGDAGTGFPPPADPAGGRQRGQPDDCSAGPRQAWPRGAPGSQWPGGARSLPGGAVRPDPDGRPDAGDGRVRDHGGDSSGRKDSLEGTYQSSRSPRTP